VTLETKRQARQGFTLVEILVGVVLASLVIAAVFVGFSYTTRQARAGTSQIRFTAEGRIAAQKIVRHIEAGKAVGLTSNVLDIVTLDLGVARLYFEDGDNNLDTVENNMLKYDPDISVNGDEVVICYYVTPIADTPMFSILATSPDSAAVAFHLGDGTNVGHRSFSGTGEGYQGVEVRISGTPRNLQRWYD